LTTVVSILCKTIVCKYGIRRQIKALICQSVNYTVKALTHVFAQKQTNISALQTTTGMSMNSSNAIFYTPKLNSAEKSEFQDFLDAVATHNWFMLKQMTCIKEIPLQY